MLAVPFRLLTMPTVEWPNRK